MNRHWTLVTAFVLSSSLLLGANLQGADSQTADLHVDVKLLSGEKTTGQLVALTTENLTLQTGDQRRSLAVKDLLTVKPHLPANEGSPAKVSTKDPPATVWIDLIDDSSLRGISYRVAEGKADIELHDGRRMEIPTRSITAVRLKSHELAQEKPLVQQWEEILQKKDSLNSDLIVIRKATGQSSTGQPAAEKAKTTFALDYLEGVLYDITGEVVHFDYDGTRIPVNRQKVEGVLYYHPAGRNLPEAVCRITAGGNVWNVRSVVLDADDGAAQLQFTSTAGVKASLPRQRLLDSQDWLLDFSAGKVVYLSDLEWESADVELFFSTGVASEKVQYRPHRDVSLMGKRLRIGDQTFDKGLAMVSRTEVVFRLPGRYRRLLAVAGIDYDVDGSGGMIGDVQLKVLGDGKPLYEGRINGQLGAVPLDIDVSGVRRLTLLVDYSEDKPKRIFGNYLNLGEARITK